MEKEQDIRYQRTRESVYQAMVALLQEKNFDSITVKEIVDRAGISRSAFYNHFEDKYLLVEQYQLTFIAKVNKLILETKDRGREMVLLKILTLLKSEDVLMSLLFSKNGSVEVQQKLLAVLRQNARLNILPYTTFEPVNEQETRYILAFMSNAVLGVIQEWINHGQQEEPIEIIRVLNQLLPFDLK